MRTRVPLRCVQATAAADTARFRLWTEPAESDYEGSIDFKGRAADFHGTRRASGRVLQVAIERGVQVKPGQVLARLDVRAATLSASELTTARSWLIQIMAVPVLRHSS